MTTLSLIVCGVVVLVLLGVLWLPSLLVALWIKPHPAQGSTHGLGFIFPIQLAVAASLSFLADYIGLLNPAGYVLGICVAVGIVGGATLALWRRSANQAINSTGHKVGQPVG